MRRLPLAAILPNYLRSHASKVYTKAELSQIIEDLAQATNSALDADPEIFIDYYIRQGVIFVIELASAKGSLMRYALHQPSPLELGTVIKKGSYFSHGTAAWLHGLISEEPPLYHLSVEVPASQSKGGGLKQEAIDSAFSKEQRKSGAIYQWKDFKFLLLNGLDSGGLGVDKKGDFTFTDMERTLLDLTVRPSYGGGAKVILQAYKKALPHISIKNLLGMLDKMDFIYPFHQSIGFYLSKIGYTGAEMKQLYRRPRPFHFYLDYAMKEPKYSEEWNIFYPNDI